VHKRPEVKTPSCKGQVGVDPHGLPMAPVRLLRCIERDLNKCRDGSLIRSRLHVDIEHGNDSVFHRAVEPDSLIANFRHFFRFAN